MINLDAMRLLDWHALQPSFFSTNERAFATNAAVFTFLKEEFKKGYVSDNDLFKWCFSAFYGMGIVRPEAQNAFFNKMESLRNQHDNVSARALTEELRGAMGKNNFSFATKMLNLLDDEAYPIYDSRVAIVFQRPFTPDETRLDHQEAIYQDVIDTYRELRNHPVIEEFRTRFHCPRIGYMKILDVLFWRLGAMLDEEGLEESPAEWLQSHGLNR